MKTLVIVEASGKVDVLKKSLRAIGIAAEVEATLGHVADNPHSLRPIALNAQLAELQYQFKPEKISLLDKIGRAAARADRIFLAMDDDQEGDVIAYDVARYLSAERGKMVRARLRALSEDELKETFSNASAHRLAVAANNGICRRIVDRAIGATFSTMGEEEAIAVGRVQSSLLASIDRQPPSIGEFMLSASLGDGSEYAAVIPVYSRVEIGKYDAIALAVKNGLSSVVSEDVADEPSARPWGYEDIVEEAALRLKVTVTQAAEVFQDAYLKGRVSYPRVRANGFTPDAVEIALTVAKQNRCEFNPQLLPMRARDEDGDGAPHECPRPLDRYMMLGRPMNVLDMTEALAVIVARNVIECGQVERRRRVVLQVGDVELRMERVESAPKRNWRPSARQAGFHAYPHDVALLRYMAQNDLGRPSTIIGHVEKCLRRGLLRDDGVSLDLNERGQRWLRRAQELGFTASTSRDMENSFQGLIQDPGASARDVLMEHGLLDDVLRLAKSQEAPVKVARYEGPSL
jgi:DNA topoisomerase-1